MMVWRSNFKVMKNIIFGVCCFFVLNVFGQDVLNVSGNSKLIADFHSTGEAPNVKGLFLSKYQTLVSVIEGTNTVKCMVRIGSMVNVIGVWELNDLNDVQVKVFEVEMTPGVTDILMIGLTDQKAIQMNLFRLQGEELIDLGYNYIEQKTAGQPFTIVIGESTISVEYDQGTEKPRYGLVEGAFTELAPH
jgi:hypothetical protein